MFTVQQETFEGENFHDFHGLRATHKSFLHKSLGVSHSPKQLVWHSTKVFSVKCSLPTDPRNFSPSKVTRYTVHCMSLSWVCLGCRKHIWKPYSTREDLHHQQSVVLWSCMGLVKWRRSSCQLSPPSKWRLRWGYHVVIKTLYVVACYHELIFPSTHTCASNRLKLRHYNLIFSRPSHHLTLPCLLSPPPPSLPSLSLSASLSLPPLPPLLLAPCLCWLPGALSWWIQGPVHAVLDKVLWLL